MNKSIDYPVTRKDDVFDEYFGEKVSDPYRWLEDDNSEETSKWVKAQNKTTFSFLNKLDSRDGIKNRLTELINYPKTGTPVKKGGWWIVSKNDGLQNQDVLFYSDRLDGEQKILLDPNKLSDDGTVALAGYDVTKDGKYLVYKVAKSGSDWNEIFVKDIEAGKLIEDHIEWVKFSDLSCYKDGFFYSAYNKPTDGDELSQKNEGQKVFYHKIGTQQKEDELIYKHPSNPNVMCAVYTDEDKKYLFLSLSKSTDGNALYVRKIEEEKFKPIVDHYNNETVVAEVVGDVIYLKTSVDAPNYRLACVGYDKPEIENAKTVIPEGESVMDEVSFLGGKWFLNYMVDARSTIEIYSQDGEKEDDLQLPGICSAGGFSGSKTQSFLFYSFTSFNTPGEIYKYDIPTGRSTLYFKPELNFNSENFIVKQEFFMSKDGTKVPMFIIHRKDIELNGDNPVLLYGYGGFNISLTPSFSSSNILFLEAGGVYAVANLRGGGEYGEKWHKDGTRLKKQNVFNDFIAAAEYLIDTGYTNSDRLAIRGGSNGGLLVGAVTNQRPELFKVALPAVGVMDMLRYHQFTIGYAWADDYGRSDESEEMFKYLHQYSPVHSVRDNSNYPAILVTTADHDDRVVPAHSFKYIARIQELNKGDLPTLIRIDTKSGHGAGKPIAKIIDEYADIWAFTFNFIGIDY